MTEDEAYFENGEWGWGFVEEYKRGIFGIDTLDSALTVDLKRARRFENLENLTT